MSDGVHVCAICGWANPMEGKDALVGQRLFLHCQACGCNCCDRCIEVCYRCRWTLCDDCRLEHVTRDPQPCLHVGCPEVTCADSGICAVGESRMFPDVAKLMIFRRYVHDHPLRVFPPPVGSPTPAKITTRRFAPQPMEDKQVKKSGTSELSNSRILKHAFWKPGRTISGTVVRHVGTQYGPLTELRLDKAMVTMAKKDKPSETVTHVILGNQRGLQMCAESAGVPWPYPIGCHVDVKCTGESDTGKGTPMTLFTVEFDLPDSVGADTVGSADDGWDDLQEAADNGQLASARGRK